MTLPASVPELAALDLFVSVVERGSLSRAAALHYISQPSASARMARLERRLGVKLLHRTPSGSIPTEAGLKLAERARDVLAVANDFDRAVNDLAMAAGGRLRVVACYTMGDYILPRWLHALGAEVSNISVEVRNSSDTISTVVDGRAELGFMCEPDLDEPLESIPVGSDELVVVVRPDHHWARRLRPLEPEHLASARLVVREERSATRSRLDDLLEPFRPDPPPVPVLELGSPGAIKAAVLDGTAPTVLSRLTVAHELESERLVEVPVGGINFRRTPYVIWPSGTPLTEQAQRLVDYVTSPGAAEVAGMNPSRGAKQRRTRSSSHSAELSPHRRSGVPGGSQPP